MQEIHFNTIPEAIRDIREGKMIIVVDDEDRENEGDFLIAGEMVTTEAINFMVTHGRGLVCSPLMWITRLPRSALGANCWCVGDASSARPK